MYLKNIISEYLEYCQCLQTCQIREDKVVAWGKRNNILTDSKWAVEERNN